MTLSTHVLDATTGRPAAGVRVLVERRAAGTWMQVGEALTGPDGRLDSRQGGWLPAGEQGPGVYRITVDSRSYFDGRGMASFYPEISVCFDVASPAEHCHVPLLLSPFAYSTYRGS